MKRVSIISALLVSLILTGCGTKTEPQLLTPGQRPAAEQDASAGSTGAAGDDKEGQDGYIEISGKEYSGEARCEITEAYITDAPGKEGIDLNRIDEYTKIMYENSEGKVEEVSRDGFLNSDGTLGYGAKMYVLHMKVTNIDAEYKHYKEEEYDSPYVFFAWGLFMNFVNDKGDAVLSKCIDYYSKRLEDDHKWASFILPPGETAEYDIGYIVGPVHRENGVTSDLDECTLLISTSMGGLEQRAEQYRLEWEDRR